MSDNTEAQVMRRRLILFLRIPAELWTDVLKLLPRRTLVQKISPVCYRLKEICNKNVPSVHPVTNNAVQRVHDNYKWNYTQVGGLFEQLTSNKDQLAYQFRLTDLCIHEGNEVILQRCLNLLKGCQISTEFHRFWNMTEKSTTFFDSLTILEPAKPFSIRIFQMFDPANNYWHHPTVLNCNRIAISTPLGPWNVNMKAMTSDIFEWLHHRPLEMADGSASAGDDQVRCLIYPPHVHEKPNLNWLLNRCIQNLQNSQSPADRRQFVLSVEYRTGPPTNLASRFGRTENHMTGEVLVLEPVPETEDKFRFRRCLAQDVANGEEFYEKMFKRENGQEHFNVEEAGGPEIIIG